MEVILWGVRGSIPAYSPKTQFYGTNTSCIEVRLDNDELLIFDAGSRASKNFSPPEQSKNICL